MGSLSANIHEAFAQAQISERLQAALQAKEEATQARWAAARAEGRVTTWDKLNVFGTSPEEAALEAAREASLQADLRLGQQERELDEALRGLAERFPPVGLWQKIDHIERLARTTLKAGGVLGKKVRKPEELLEALRGLAEGVLGLYAPGFKLDDALQRLRDGARCRELALPVEGLVRRDDAQGWSPLLQEQLEGVIAGRLLEAGFFQGEAELRALEQEEAARQAEVEEARARVGVWADLNVFSDSPEEQERNARVERAREARERRVMKDEEQQLAMLEAFDAHPPLALHRQVGTIIGVLDKLHTVEESYLKENGDFGVHAVVAPRALLLERIRQLRRAFLKTFPGFPMPNLRPHGSMGIALGARNQLLAEFSEAMERRGGRAQLEECGRQAGALYWLGHQRRRVDRAVGLTSKLMFWSADPAQARAALLERRTRERGEALLSSWGLLLGEAQEVAHALPPLRVRALGVRAALHAQAIGTGGGCTVNQERHRAVVCFGEVRASMEAAYGLRGDRRSLMSDVSSYLAAHPSPSEPSAAAQGLDPTVFRVRPYDEVVALVAGPLRGSGFHERFERMDATSRQASEAREREAEAEHQVSFWDKLNVFTDTEAERARDAAQGEKERLDAELEQHASEVNRAFDEAMRGYPPAAVYYQLHGVEAALQRIYARWETRTYTDSKGKTRTRRVCKMYGKDLALATISRWIATLVGGFGELPDTHECLDAWIER
jgi:hypothetical protein